MGRFGMGRASVAGWAALLVCLTILAWIGGLAGPYQFDDYVTPLGDPASQSLSDWAARATRTLRPLTKLTYAVEADLGWDKTPGPRRLGSILLLGAAAAVLMATVRRLEPGLPGWIAFAVALLWAVHPVHAENILQVCGRTVVLSSLLLIGAVWAALLDRRWLAALLLVMAGLSRETALASVAVLAAVELSRRHPGEERPWARWIPLTVATLFLCAWYASTDRYWELADYSLRGRPFLASLSAQVAAVPMGLSLFWRPEALSVDYGVALPRTPWSAGFALGILVYAVAFAGLAIGVVKKSPALAVGAAVWLAAVLPTQSLVPKLDALTSRPLSLALAGCLIAAVPLMARIAEWSRPARAVLALLAAGLAFWLGGSTLARERLYSSELLLWEDAAAKSVVNPRPHLYFALLLQAEGRHVEARSELGKAREIDPFDSRIAVLWQQMEEPEKTP